MIDNITTSEENDWRCDLRMHLYGSCDFIMSPAFKPEPDVGSIMVMKKICHVGGNNTTTCNLDCQDRPVQCVPANSSSSEPSAQLEEL